MYCSQRHQTGGPGHQRGLGCAAGLGLAGRGCGYVVHASDSVGSYQYHESEGTYNTVSQGCGVRVIADR
jgi:hypothetical protein